MIERTPIFDLVTQLFLLTIVVVMCFPIYILLVTASQSSEGIGAMTRPLLPDLYLLQNMSKAWLQGHFGEYFINSLITSLMIMTGKIVIAVITAFAIVYFRFRGRQLAFAFIFLTLMLPLEVRIVPTYEVAANALVPFQTILEWTGVKSLVEWATGIRISLAWSLINSYWGLTLPLIATATGTFLFRQFFLTVPDELTEAAIMDGAGPIRFLFDVLLPISRTNIASLAIIMFVYGWNQYLWPLLVTTGDTYRTLTLGLSYLAPSAETSGEWNTTLAGALIVMAPPVLVVVLAQRWFVRGLVNTEK